MSDIIVVRVGPLQKRFTVHRSVLTRAKYFHRCLEGNFIENQMRKIILPEDDPSVFEKLIEYLYAGKICAQKFDTLLQEPPEIEHMSLLARVYVAADKYCMEDCQSHVLDHFWDFHVGKASRVPCPQAIAELRDLPKSPLRKLLIRKLAFCLCSKANEHRELIEREKAILDMVAGGGADAQDLFTACLDSIARTGVVVEQRRCRFHVHDLTECKKR